MRQTFREAPDRSFGCVVRSVTPISHRLEQKLPTECQFDAYGGFVMPSLDPVLIMTD